MQTNLAALRYVRDTSNGAIQEQFLSDFESPEGRLLWNDLMDKGLIEVREDNARIQLTLAGVAELEE